MKTETIANVHAKAVAACFLHQADKNEIRYYLHGIYMEPCDDGGAYVVATNGHTLLAVHDPDGDVDSPIILRVTAPTATKCKPKKAKRLLVERTGEIIIANVQGIEFRALAELVDGRFPDWRRVVPEEEPKKPAEFPTVDSKYLAKMGQSAAVMAMERYPAIRAFSTGDTSVLAFVFEAHGLTATGCVMPMRAERVAWPWTQPKPTKPKKAA